MGPVADLPAIAEDCSQSERRAADAERELVEWKKVKFMADRVGEDFDALIITTAKYGLFVELADLFIEGLVPIDTLPGDSTRIRRMCARSWASARGANSRSATGCG